jgi:signal transduction histidine kinase
MRNYHQPLAIDWITLTIRWVFVLAVSLWLVFSVGVVWLLLAVPIAVAVINITATIWVLLSSTDTMFRIASIIVDMLGAYLLYYLALSLGVDSLGWFSFLPLLSAALYFQWIGVGLLTFLNGLILGGISILFAPLSDVLFMVGIFIPLYLIVGLPLAYLSQHLAGGTVKKKKQKRPARVETSSPERQRRRTMINLVSALSATLNYQRVLETSLDLSTSTLIELGAPADKLISAVLLFSNGSDSADPELMVAASRRLLSADTRVTLPGQSGLIGRTIDNAEPQITRRVNKDPELSHFVALHSCRSGYTYPLRTGLDAYGIMVFAHPDPDFFNDERCEVLEIVGNQSVIAIQNARLYQDLEQEKERMMEIQEEARKKMARDLHDGPTQSVSAIAMRVNFARRLLERDEKAAAEELYKIEDLARRTTKEIRHMLFTLRPLVLESQGLTAALESMAEKMRETYDQNVIIEADPRVVDALEMGKQAVVFYIAEEAVNNARKHAEADHIWVRLKMVRDGLCLLDIEDDGAGFDAGAVDMSYESRGSLGMVNMRERTDLVNGVLRIDAAIGRGTRIQVIIPLSEEAADRIRHGL